MAVIAMDIDGTVSTAGEWFVRLLANEFRLPLAEAALASIQSSRQFWALPEVQALPAEQRQAMRELALRYQHDAEAQQNAVPMPDAVLALNQLAKQHTIVYTTCRRQESQQGTQDWLARHGFPEPERVYCCPHYDWKYKYIEEIAEKSQKMKIVLFDDQAEMMVKAFRHLAKMDHRIALSLVLRLTLVAFGQAEPPTFPMRLPFPVLALPSWQEEDIAVLVSSSSSLQGNVPTVF